VAVEESKHNNRGLDGKHLVFRYLGAEFLCVAAHHMEDLSLVKTFRETKDEVNNSVDEHQDGE